jgi:hypothetical protein
LSAFTLKVLQAINDWQRGGDHKQKVKRGNKLKHATKDLPSRFQTCSIACYRQEAHEKGRVWQLLADNMLPETISAWTSDISVAKDFKNGVPPVGFQGVIFKITPPPGSVVLNIVEVYREPAFRTAVEAHKREITGFGDGIGRYDDTQKEVVLELDSLTTAAIYSYGGYASNHETLAEEHFGHPPTTEEVAQFADRYRQAHLPEARAWWLSPEGTQNVLGRMESQIERLRLSKS